MTHPTKGKDAMTEYHLYHPETQAVIVVDRMTRLEARKRNEALEAMKYPYRWQVSPPVSIQLRKAA